MHAPEETLWIKRLMTTTVNTDMITKAVCLMTPTEGNDVKGLITFTQTEGGILIVADIEGLTEGKHGFHIHEWGDISKSDGTSAGGLLIISRELLYSCC